MGSSYISAVNWDMSMKFGLWIDFQLQKSVTTSNTKPDVVRSRRGRYLDIVYDVNTPQRVARFGRNLVTWYRTARKLLRSGQNSRGKNSNRHIENRTLPYFFVFLMQFWLQRAAAFVSSPIHFYNNCIKPFHCLPLLGIWPVKSSCSSNYSGRLACTLVTKQ